MIEIYWGCLIFGVLFAVVTVLLGDLFSNALHGMLDFLSVDFLRPVVIATAVTVWGGAGILLTEYTSFPAVLTGFAAAICAILVSALVYIGYVRPMNRSETSIGYSMKELAGRVVEVSVPIPANGYGEVLLRGGIGNTNEIAASFDQTDIQAGTKVVVVEVKDNTLYVSRFES